MLEAVQLAGGIALLLATLVVGAQCLYLLTLTLLSVRTRAPAGPPPTCRFDIVVPAHDEAAGIERTVASLLDLDWPKGDFRVLVVADNCSDDTAVLARQAGATVLERRDEQHRGKGYALAHAFEASRAAGFAEALVIVDADSVVSRNLLASFAARLATGERALQAHYGVLNVEASWRTRLMAIALGSFHVLRSRAREKLGLSCGIRGNGWCVTHSLLRDVPYRAFSLVEDIEFGIEIALAMQRVSYCGEAQVLGEMVTSGRSAASQRRRWEGGRAVLVRSALPRLIRGAFRGRSVVCLDLAIDLLVPPLATLATAVVVLAMVSAAIWPAFPAAITAWLCAACVAVLIAYVLRGWQLSGVGPRGLLEPCPGSFLRGMETAPFPAAAGAGRLDPHGPGIAVIPRIARGSFLHMLGSAVSLQALLSLNSFLLGIILIRQAGGVQFGYYVLISNALLLALILQGAFLQPPLVPRLARADTPQRADIIGGVLRDLRRIWPLTTLACGLTVVVLRLCGVIGWSTFLLLTAAALALQAALYRDFFRMLLLGLRRPQDLVWSDAAYVALTIGGTWLACRSAEPAILAVAVLAFACLLTGARCANTLKQQIPWNMHGEPGILRALAPLGFWSAMGAVIHWLFSQGYNYVVAGVIDANAVAGIAAARLLIMPVNLLSSGIGSVMLPTVSGWLEHISERRIITRLTLFSLVLSAVAAAYFSVVWLLRDWLFANVFKHHVEDLDLTLALWFAAGILMLLRDQWVYLPLARGRMRSLAALTFVSAVTALTVGYLQMRSFGAAGMLMGLVLGELLNVAGILVLARHELGTLRDQRSTGSTT